MLKWTRLNRGEKPLTAKSSLQVEKGKHANYAFSIYQEREGGFSLYWDDGRGNGDHISHHATMDEAKAYAEKCDLNLLYGKVGWKPSDERGKANVGD